MKSLKNFFKLLANYKAFLFLSKTEKKFIIHNKNKWKLNKKSTNTENIILVDLFYWMPWIYIWSYLTNILSYRLNAKIKYFYFNLHHKDTLLLSGLHILLNKLFIYKLTKIFKSFNVSKGIDERDFIYSNKEVELFTKKFEKINSNTQKLLNYKKKRHKNWSFDL